MLMKKISICIISPDYPSKDRPVFTFVEQLVEEFAVLGAHCIVIAPFSITKSIMKWTSFTKKYEVKKTKCGDEIEIRRPRFISFSNLEIFGFSLSRYYHACAVGRELKKIKDKPDILYSHFWVSGRECYPYAIKNDIKMIIASGESTIPNIMSSKKYNISDFRDYISGVICVSEKNKTESIKKGLITPQKCIVLHNGVDLSKFYLKNKHDSRKALGFSDSDFIIVFVGHFNHRKGISRLTAALKILNEQKIKSIFIGSGPLVPDCEGILFKGSINHDSMVDYLNCGDIFILPTLNEGCCNAIIEAMACGLPIISSDLPFNHEILNNENSILVNPNDIGAISNAIMQLKNDLHLREKLSFGALKTAKSLSIKGRAEKIIKFIDSFL